MHKSHWIDYVKEAAIQAVKSEKPCNYVVGLVSSVNPLKIKLSDGDGVELGADFLHLARNVTDFQETITVSGKTQNVKFHGALKKGEKVLMLRKWGGQDYFIIDRVVKP